MVPAAGGATTWLKTPGDPRNTYIASLEWIDAATVAMQQLNRLQNENHYLLADAATGTRDARLRGHVVRRRSSDLVGRRPGRHPWIDGGRAFLWLSERDGWRQIYRVTRDGEARHADHELRGRGHRPRRASSEQDGVVYFMASPENATQRYLYRAPLDGSARAASA